MSNNLLDGTGSCVLEPYRDTVAGCCVSFQCSGVGKARNAWFLCPWPSRMTAMLRWTAPVFFKMCCVRFAQLLQNIIFYVYIYIHAYYLYIYIHNNDNNNYNNNQHCYLLFVYVLLFNLFDLFIIYGYYILIIAISITIIIIYYDMIFADTCCYLPPLCRT